MRILAIETTSMTASAAIVEENKTIAEFTLDYKMTHSQTIMPLIDEMFKFLKIEKSSIDYIACANGPGSFTGLRIGAATAKGIAVALNKKIIPVSGLDAMAYNVLAADRFIVPIIDARRNQVFNCIYTLDNDGRLQKIKDYDVTDIDELLDYLKENDMRTIFLGDGVLIHKDKITAENEKGADFKIAGINLNMPRAAAVGAAAMDNIDKAVESEAYEIMYLRKSQAEREYEERNRV